MQQVKGSKNLIGSAVIIAQLCSNHYFNLQ